MVRILLVQRFIFFIVICAAIVSPISASAQFEAGAAAVEITPVLCADATTDARTNQYDIIRDCYRWVHLGGFSPFVPFRTDARLATGIHDPLWARSLALRDDTGTTVVLVAVDLPGLGRKHTGPVRRRIAADYGLPTTNIIIHSTHTHSAPDASGYWSTLMSGNNRRYGKQVRTKLYESIASALDTLRPADLRTATTTHLSCIERQTGILKSDPYCSFPSSSIELRNNPEAYDQYLIQRDQRDPIVRNTRIVTASLTDTETKAPIATFVNWHNHPDTLGSSNRLISSDYPHYLREYLEEHAGGLGIYAVGTLGNQIGGLRGTPVPLWNQDGERVYETAANGSRRPVLVNDGWDKIRSTGYEIADAALNALTSAAPRHNPRIRVRSTELDVPIDNAIHILGTWSVWHDGAEPPERLQYHWPTCWGILGCVRAEISLIEIGDLSLLTAPGEIDPAYAIGRTENTTDYGPPWGLWTFPSLRGIDDRMPGTHHGFLGSTHDYLSYMVPVEDNVGWWNFSHPNHYEEWVTISKHFGDKVANAWDELVEEDSK